ncbi:MAG: 50S ribosomal protein L13 [Myxococcota bacterium]|jgi:large subunit ribosomal protein L13|nr:50S ribosomal protein L13 [Myxococcota bacterium]
MKTYHAKPGEVTREWWLVDAAGKPLGRVASKIASVIRGKHKPEFTPSTDTGDFVIVINADKVLMTGRKESEKKYYNYSGYFGGLKETVAEKVLEKHPERILQIAVRGMLPKNRLGRRLNRKLKIYSSPDHPHQAQQPKPLEI